MRHYYDSAVRTISLSACVFIDLFAKRKRAEEKSGVASGSVWFLCDHLSLSLSPLTNLPPRRRPRLNTSTRESRGILKAAAGIMEEEADETSNPIGETQRSLARF